MKKTITKTSTDHLKKAHNALKVAARYTEMAMSGGDSSDAQIEIATQKSGEALMALIKVLG